MSRELPANANLEHLKNQAKDRLAELRRHSRSARLADAQHAIATEYGFASWAALKAHVESIEENYHFERYTIEARRATVIFRFSSSTCRLPSARRFATRCLRR